MQYYSEALGLWWCLLVPEKMLALFAFLSGSDKVSSSITCHVDERLLLFCFLAGIVGRGLKLKFLHLTL